MKEFKVPTRAEVSEKNQAIFDNLKKSVGFVPNLYAAMGHSKSALASYLPFSGSPTSFSKKEKEVIDLAISQVNDCRYCQAAHSSIAKMNGFNEEQILELRKGGASWDAKTDALAKMAKSMAETRGKVPNSIKQNFYAAGYTEEHLVDLVVAGGIINITNNLHNLTNVAIDFPSVPVL